MKTISLAITCWHKDLHFLPQTLNYINSQTVKPDEIIVVANNVGELSIEDKSIKTFFVNERKPVSWSRNKAAELSNCDIISFFDVDDIPHPQKIEATKQLFDTTDADCFVHGFTEFSDTKDHYSNFDFCKINELTHDGYLKIPNGDNKDLHHGHLAAKRDVIIKNRYNEMLGFYELGFKYWGEDSEICNRLFNSNYKFYYSNCKLVNYRPSYKDNERFWYIP
jgi:glycosyltransferase involved in cell wall biosynthesis